jgi:hypothetical protein
MTDPLREAVGFLTHIRNRIYLPSGASRFARLSHVRTFGRGRPNDFTCGPRGRPTLRRLLFARTSRPPTQRSAQFRTPDELVLMNLILRNACPSNPGIASRRRIISRRGLFIQPAKVRTNSWFAFAACLVLRKPIPVRLRCNEAGLPV